MGKTSSSNLFILAICTIIVTATNLVHADNTAQTPDAIFQQRSLTRFGTWLVLPGEAEVHDRVWALRQSDDAVRGQTSTHRSLMPEIQQGMETLDKIEQQRKAADKTLNRLRDKNDDQSIDQYNKTITQSDMLWSQYVKEVEMIDGLTEREGRVEEARARFISGVTDTESKAEALAAAYSRLSQDAVLTNAIAQANANAQQPLTLGPSIAFTNDLEFLRAAAKKIVSAWVVVDKTSTIGGLHVLPILNGKLTTSMIWDSGCSLTRLSSATGKSLGLKLTDRDPTVEAEIANGAKVKGRLVFLDSIQLGPFTLRNVLCEVAVGEADDADSPDLLGNSFQSHFLSRLDQQTGRLQLTPIDSSVEVGTIAEPAMLTQAAAPGADNPTPPRPVNLDIARQATATASSTLAGSDPSGAIDGVLGGAPDNPRSEWVCDQPTGSITLTWDQPASIGAIKLWDRLNGTDHILSGQLVFDDGSVVPFGELPGNRKALGMRFAPHVTRWLRVEILTVSPGTEHPGFAEISVFK